MKYVKAFIQKPRNMYFSIILMLTLVMGLVSVSFSYYVDESSRPGVLKNVNVDNRLQITGYAGNKISFEPHETKELEVYIMSNNDFSSVYKIYYNKGVNVYVYADTKISGVITAKEVQKYKFMITNNEEVPVEFELGLASATLNGSVDVDSNLVELVN